MLSIVVTHSSSHPLLLPVVTRQVPVHLLVDPAAAVLVREEVRQWGRRPGGNRLQVKGASLSLGVKESQALTRGSLSPAGGHSKRDVGHLSALGTIPPAGLRDVVLVYKHGPLGSVLTQLFGRDHARLDRVPVQSHDVGRGRCAEGRQGAVGVPTGQNCQKSG